MAAKDRLGRRGERIAADFLRRQGYELLARNWRCPSGEIDIVARDGETVVVCEVKTRSSEEYGSPAEAVTGDKADRLRRLAGEWLRGWDRPHGGLRIDVVGVRVLPAGGYAVEHLPGVA